MMGQLTPQPSKDHGEGLADEGSYAAGILVNTSYVLGLQSLQIHSRGKWHTHFWYPS